MGRLFWIAWMGPVSSQGPYKREVGGSEPVAGDVMTDARGLRDARKGP